MNQLFLERKGDSLPTQGAPEGAGMQVIEDQPGGEQTVREVEIDTLGPARCAPASSNADHDADQRAGRCLWGR